MTLRIGGNFKTRLQRIISRQDSLKRAPPADGRVQRGDERLKDRLPRVGHLTVYPELEVTHHPIKEYSCECDCGESAQFTAPDILWLADQNLGCLQWGCAFTPAVVTQWTDWRWCLWLQLNQALARFPEATPDSYGGSGWTDEPVPLTREAHHRGFTTLYHLISNLNTGNYYGWNEFYSIAGRFPIPLNTPWLNLGEERHRQKPWAFHGMRTTPHPHLFTKGRLYVVQYGVTTGKDALSLEQAAQDFGVNYEAAALLQKQLADDELLLELLSEDSTMVNKSHDKLKKAGTHAVPEIFTPDREGFSELTGLVQRSENYKVAGPRRYHYNILVEPYNSAPIGSIIVMPQSAHLKQSNVTNILVNRGLVYGVDFNLNKPFRRPDGETVPADERHLLLTKLTSRLLKSTTT